jgi:hypothetical protein
MKKIKRDKKINRYATKFAVTTLLLASISVFSLFSIPVSACSYTVGTYENDLETPKDLFIVGEYVYAKGTSDVHTLLKLRIIDPSGNIVFYSNESYYEVNCSYFLNKSAQTGMWKVQLGIYKCCWRWSTYYNKISYFSVNRSNFSLSIDIVGDGSVFKDPDKSFYEFGDVVNLTAVAGVGWIFDSWSGDLVGGNVSDSVFVDGDKSVIALFIEDQFQINISITGNGTVLKDPDQVYYSYGSSVNLTAIADPGWIFYEWEGDISGNANPKNISVNSNLNITAIFIKKYYTLDIIICPVDSGIVIADPLGPYNEGDVVNITAIPNQGVTFDRWSGDKTGSDNPTDLMMDSNKTIIAIFNYEIYNLTIEIEGNGIVLREPDEQGYSFGSNVNLTAIADPDWIFDHWSGDLSGIDNSSSINMTEEKNVTAHFVLSNENGGNGEGGGTEEPTGGNGGTKSTSSKPNKSPISDAGGPYSGFTNETITFDGSNSYDPDGYIKSWSWDFGDGSTGDGEFVNHIFKEPGEYNITLVVTDSKNLKRIDKTKAFVSDQNHAPIDLYIIGPTEGFTNIKYTYYIYSSDEDGDKIKYTIEWGDGNKSESIFFPSGKEIQTTKTWSEEGNYTIVLTADDNKSITTKELEITIDEPISEPDIPEEFNLALIFLLIIAFILLMLLLLFARKRRKNKQEEDNNKSQ